MVLLRKGRAPDQDEVQGPFLQKMWTLAKKRGVPRVDENAEEGKANLVDEELACWTRDREVPQSSAKAQPAQAGGLHEPKIDDRDSEEKAGEGNCNVEQALL